MPRKPSTPDQKELNFIKENITESDGKLYLSGKPLKGKNGLYTRVRIQKTMRYAHRIIWFIHKGVWPTLFIDHINGNHSDNRIENLREVTHEQNNKGCKKVSTGAKSKYRGVSPCKGRWQSSIKCKGVKHHLGTYKTEEEAARAYNEAAIRFGFFPEALNKLD